MARRLIGWGNVAHAPAGVRPPAEAVQTRLTLLRGFRLQRGGVALRPTVSGRRVVALLCLLGMLGPVSRSAAAGTLWQDVPEKRALASLRTTVWRLRKLARSLRRG